MYHMQVICRKPYCSVSTRANAICTLVRLENKRNERGLLSLDNRTRQRLTAMSLFTTLVFLELGLLCPGCDIGSRNVSSNEALDVFIDRVPGIDKDSDWIRNEFKSIKGDRLLSIVTSPEWDSVTLFVRWVEDSCVNCRKIRKQGGAVQRSECYRICDSEAVAMFRNLYEQAACGYEFRSARWRESSNPGGVYVIATGNLNGLTVDEGSEFDTVISEIIRWRNAEFAGEPIHDRDLAFSYFDRDVFPSFASYVVMGVEYFDQLCEVAQASITEQGKTAE